MRDVKHLLKDPVQGIMKIVRGRERGQDATAIIFRKKAAVAITIRQNGTHESQHRLRSEKKKRAMFTMGRGAKSGEGRGRKENYPTMLEYQTPTKCTENDGGDRKRRVEISLPHSVALLRRPAQPFRRGNWFNLIGIVHREGRPSRLEAWGARL